MSNLYGMDMTKFMFGQNAVHMPAWMVLQNSGVATTFIGSTKQLPVFEASRTHTLFLGEMILRPHIVVTSNEYIGKGIANFLLDPGTEAEWIEKGAVLINNKVSV